MGKIWFTVLTVTALAVAACSAIPPNLAARPRAAAKYSKELLLSMERAPEKTKKAWVFLTDKPDPDGAAEDLTYLEKLDRPVSETYQAELERLGAKIRTASRWLNAVSIEANPEVLSEIGDLPFVSRVEQVRGAKREDPAKTADGSCDAHETDPPPSVPGDLDYGYSFTQLTQLHVPELHQMGLSGRGVTIALLDVGFRKDHEVFTRSHLIAERDFVMGDDGVSRDPADGRDYDDGHGTMVFSVIGGFNPGELIGPAFGANYLLAKTEDDRSETPKEEDYWVAGLEWAKTLGARIVSSSLGYIAFDDGSSHSYSTLDGQTIVTSRAVNVAAQFGILVVNAVGNEGEDPVSGKPRPGSLAAPADALEGLAVGAVDPFGRIADFSSRGPTADGRIKPDVVAQGVDVWVATNDRPDSYDCANGTSFATPLVAGLAALLWEAHPEWTAQMLREALRTTATGAGRPGNIYGYGLADGRAALDYQPAETPLLAMAD